MGDMGQLPSSRGMEQLIHGMISQEEPVEISSGRQVIQRDVREALQQCRTPQELGERLSAIEARHTEIITSRFGNSAFEDPLTDILQGELQLGKAILMDRAQSLTPGISVVMAEVSKLDLSQRQLILESPTSTQKFLSQFELTQGERRAAVGLLMEGSFKWQSPGANRFTQMISEFQSPRGLSPTPFGNMSLFSMNCWESALTCSVLSGSCRIEDVSGLRTYRGAFATSQGEATENVLQTHPEDIWGNLDFYSHNCIPAGNLNSIPPGQLVFYVPETPAETGVVGNPKNMPAFKGVPDLFKGSNNLFDLGYLTNPSPNGQKGTVTSKAMALQSPADLNDPELSHLNGKQKEILFQKLKGAAIERQHHIALMQEFGEKGPYPVHVALSVGGGKCMSLWDQPAIPDSGTAPPSQILDISTFSPGNRIFVGPNPF